MQLFCCSSHLTEIYFWWGGKVFHHVSKGGNLASDTPLSRFEMKVNPLMQEE
jgi:hypothetical protein